jgi:succinate dehydrogenase/fumarate reductase flavoprotein subunit
VSIHVRSDGTQVRYPHLIWDRAKPGMMAVNGVGDRFVDEATSYHEFVRAMYRSHQHTPTIPAYLICDARFVVRWGLGLALPGHRSRRPLLNDGYLYRAQSLPDLARQLGLDADRLTAAATQFNAAARSGDDALFGKGKTAYDRYLGDPDHCPNPCLGPLEHAPFYAVAVYPGDIGTALGIACDENGQALDAAGQPVAGLYLAGNDMHSVMGGQSPAAGSTLGPALTFGWLAAKHLARAAVPEGRNQTASEQRLIRTPTQSQETARCNP